MTSGAQRAHLDRLAHDLKNPIAVITGFADLLLLRDDEQTHREAPQQILAATAQLTALVEQMLETLPVEPPPLLDVAAGGGEGRAVVVADDDRLLRRLLTTMLPADCFRVLEADDGVEALDLVRRCNAALLLLDLSMPRRSGVEVLAELREQRPDLPVIVVSAQPGDSGREEALALGAVASRAPPRGAGRRRQATGAARVDTDIAVIEGELALINTAIDRLVVKFEEYDDPNHSVVKATERRIEKAVS